MILAIHKLVEDMELLRQERTGGSKVLSFKNESQLQNASNFLRTVANPTINIDVMEIRTDLSQDSKITSTNTEVKGTSQMNDQDIILKYIDILDKDRREMEKRLTEDRKETESRISATIDRMEASVNELSHDVKQTRGLTITAVIGIAAIIIASVFALAQIVTQLVSIAK